jgi:hypothetical protein
MPSFGFYHKGRLLELFKGADPTKLESSIQRLSTAHAKTAFTGSGNSMVGGTPAAGIRIAQLFPLLHNLLMHSLWCTNDVSGRAAAPAAAAGASGAKRERKNPWADAGVGISFRTMLISYL